MLVLNLTSFSDEVLEEEGLFGIFPCAQGDVLDEANLQRLSSEFREEVDPRLNYGLSYTILPEAVFDDDYPLLEVADSYFSRVWRLSNYREECRQFTESQD